MVFTLILLNVQAVLFGVMSIALALMVSEMKNSSLFKIISVIGGMLTGPIAGSFFLGIFIPWADTIVRANGDVLLFTQAVNIKQYVSKH